MFVCSLSYAFFFFFKQRTAYELRISDWSSDLCSSDLFSTGTRLNSKRNERIAAFMVDDLRDDDKGVVIAAWPFSDDPYTRAERLDVYSGRRVVVARAPVQNAEFVTDGGGDVRFDYGAGSDNAHKLYYRDGRGREWRLLNEERQDRKSGGEGKRG